MKPKVNKRSVIPVRLEKTLITTPLGSITILIADLLKIIAASTCLNTNSTRVSQFDVDFFNVVVKKLH